MDKKIKAYENLWNKILEIENFTSKIIFFDDILLESEYNMKESYEILWYMESKSSLLNDKSVEKDRIYISDYLYKMFFTYRAILLRCHLMYYNWMEKWNIVKFNKDSWIISQLKNILNEEEIKIALNKTFWWLSFINELFKKKFLNEIKKEKDEDNVSENKVQNITIWTIHNSWNFALENNWTQNINNQIDEIIKILDEKNIEQKEEIKKLLEEFKETWDKKSLEKWISILWSLSSAWSLVTWIIWLLWQ